MKLVTDTLLGTIDNVELVRVEGRRIYAKLGKKTLVLHLTEAEADKVQRELVPVETGKVGFVGAPRS